jgi:hypothetical protein
MTTASAEVIRLEFLSASGEICVASLMRRPNDARCA